MTLLPVGRRRGNDSAPTEFTLTEFNPTAMASPPTVTTAALSSTSLLGAGAVAVESWSPSLRHLGNLSWETTTSWTAGAAMGNQIDKSRNEAWSVEFRHGGSSKVELRFSGAGSFRVYADGQIALDYTYPTVSTQYLLDFGSQAVRTIRVDMSRVGFNGLRLPAAAWVTPTPARPKLYVLGDSWVEGASYYYDGGTLKNNSDLMHMAFLTGRLLDASCFIGGISGSGYVGRQSVSEHYAAEPRMLNVVRSGAACVVVFGSINDSTSSAPEGANATTLYSRIAADLPTTDVVVVGRQSYGTSALTNSSPYLKTAALAAPNVVTYADPRAENWVTGTGNSTAPAGDGTADIYHNGDNTSHLTVAGNRYYAERLAALVAAAMPPE